MSYTNFVNGNAPYISEQTLNNMQIELMKLVFPIGSTYITQEETNPSTILNFGTWERVKGKVLVGLDEDDTAFNTIGKTGGEKTHTLTLDEIPTHNHNVELNGYPVVNSAYTAATGWNAFSEGSAQTIGAPLGTANKGGNQPHNILQPYQVVGYMWIRTA